MFSADLKRRVTASKHSGDGGVGSGEASRRLISLHFVRLPFVDRYLGKPEVFT